MTDFASRILLEEDGLIAWNKPPHLPSTGHTLDDPGCAQHLAISHYRRMVWAVHQLDAETSGLLLFVRRKTLVAHWQALLTASSTVKEYIAIVHGAPTIPNGLEELVVEAPIARRSLDQGFKMYVDPSGKHARTDLRVLDSNGRFSLLRLRIHTGRTHQIRVHLEHLGLALVGEQRYRPEPCDAHSRHALHAHRIVTQASVIPGLVAPIPQDLIALARELGLQIPPDLT
jgi:23S rRNA-/tRNA-specific pseudouridylate synthase